MTIEEETIVKLLEIGGMRANIKNLQKQREEDSRNVLENKRWCKEKVNELFRSRNEHEKLIDLNASEHKSCQLLHDKVNGMRADAKSDIKEITNITKYDRQWWIERIIGVLALGFLGWKVFGG